jgi:hypothetical protein
MQLGGVSVVSASTPPTFHLKRRRQCSALQNLQTSRCWTNVFSPPRRSLQTNCNQLSQYESARVSSIRGRKWLASTSTGPSPMKDRFGLIGVSGLGAALKRFLIEAAVTRVLVEYLQGVQQSAEREGLGHAPEMSFLREEDATGATSFMDKNGDLTTLQNFGGCKDILPQKADMVSTGFRVVLGFIRAQMKECLRRALWQINSFPRVPFPKLHRRDDANKRQATPPEAPGAKRPTQ